VLCQCATGVAWWNSVCCCAAPSLHDMATHVLQQGCAAVLRQCTGCLGVLMVTHNCSGFPSQLCGRDRQMCVCGSSPISCSTTVVFLWSPTAKHCFDIGLMMRLPHTEFTAMLYCFRVRELPQHSRSVSVQTLPTLGAQHIRLKKHSD
jgi:hypothetical protein